jgi:hypothetical protein
MAAADLTESRCASERGLAMGGGRPAERRFTVGGSGKSVARCHRTLLAYWKFESISLQRGVSNEPCGCRGRRTRWDSEFESALLQRGVKCELDPTASGTCLCEPRADCDNARALNLVFGLTSGPTPLVRDANRGATIETLGSTILSRVGVASGPGKGPDLIARQLAAFKKSALVRSLL